MKGRTSTAYRPRPTPILGPLAKTAVGTRCGGEKRRKLLVLLAAYADAGEHSPLFSDLHARLPYLPTRRTAKSVRLLDGLLTALERDGHITIHRAKPAPNVYELHLG